MYENLLQQPSRTNIPSMYICRSEWKYEKCIPRVDRQIGREERKKQDRKKKVLCRKAIWSTQLLNPMRRSVCYKGWGNDTNKPVETWHSFLEYLLHFSCKYSGHIEDIKKWPLIQILLLGWLFRLSIPEYNPPQATLWFPHSPAEWRAALYELSHLVMSDSLRPREL